MTASFVEGLKARIAELEHELERNDEIVTEVIHDDDHSAELASAEIERLKVVGIGLLNEKHTLKNRVSELEAQISEAEKILNEVASEFEPDWQQILMQLPVALIRLVYVENGRWKGKPAFHRISRQEFDSFGTLWTVSNDPDRRLILVSGEPQQTKLIDMRVQQQREGQTKGRAAQALKEQEAIVRNLDNGPAEAKALQIDRYEAARANAAELIRTRDAAKAAEDAADAYIREHAPISFQFPLGLGED